MGRQLTPLIRGEYDAQSPASHFLAPGMRYFHMRPAGLLNMFVKFSKSINSLVSVLLSVLADTFDQGA